MSRNDGGPAFPAVLYGQYKSVSYTGMSLRDYIAIKVMLKLIEGDDDVAAQEWVAKQSYRQADAMLFERQLNEVERKLAEEENSNGEQ